MSEVDRMMIANVSDKILGHPRAFKYLSQKVEDSQKKSNWFQKSSTFQRNTSQDLKGLIQDGIEEEDESDKVIESDQV